MMLRLAGGSVFAMCLAIALPGGGAAESTPAAPPAVTTVDMNGRGTADGSLDADSFVVLR